jgi:hypothetical protein
MFVFGSKYQKRNSPQCCVSRNGILAKRQVHARVLIHKGFQEKLEFLAFYKDEEHDKQNEEEHYEDEQVLTFQEEDQEAPSENHDYEGENEEQRNKCCKVVQCAPNRIGVL